MRDTMGRWVVVVVVGMSLFCGQTTAYADLDHYFDDEESGAEVAGSVDLPDPLEPVNRAFFAVNDALYFWVLKPAGTAWRAVLPVDIRLLIRNFFHNISAPIRAVNALLQGQGRKSAVVVGRFVVNTTVGVGGLGDPAAKDFGLAAVDEDLGQTLGVWGAGPGPYICWPLLGPSSLRDTIGDVGDGFLQPLNYLETGANLAARVGEKVNGTSFRLGEYERLKAASVDPYVAVRQAYGAIRKSKIAGTTRE